MSLAIDKTDRASEPSAELEPLLEPSLSPAFVFARREGEENRSTAVRVADVSTPPVPARSDAEVTELHRRPSAAAPAPVAGANLLQIPQLRRMPTAPRTTSQDAPPDRMLVVAGVGVVAALVALLSLMVSGAVG